MASRILWSWFFIVQILYPNKCNKSSGNLANDRHLVGTIDEADEVSLVDIAVPARPDEVPTLVGQHLVGELLAVIPAVGDVDGQKLTINVSANGVGDGDLVGSDTSGTHCAATLHDYVEEVNGFFGFFSSFNSAPTTPTPAQSTTS